MITCFLVISDEVLLRMRSVMTTDKKLFSSSSSTGTVTTNEKSVISPLHSNILYFSYILLIKLSYTALIFTVLAIQFVGPAEFRSASKLTSSSAEKKCLKPLPLNHTTIGFTFVQYLRYILIRNIRIFNVLCREKH